MKDSSGLEIWNIKSENSVCKFLCSGFCLYSVKGEELFEKWCRKDICELKID